MQRRRVVVTGVGLVSPIGIGTEASWAALLAGKSGIGPITKFDASDYTSRIAGEVEGFEAGDYFDRKDIKKADLHIQYAVAAAGFALSDSGLAVTADNAYLDADFQSRPGSWINVANGSSLHIEGVATLAGGALFGLSTVAMALFVLADALRLRTDGGDDDA